MLTQPLEPATRVRIDGLLRNLGWNIDEFHKDCNVFTGRVRTTSEQAMIRKKFPRGRFPDYVLYSTGTYIPLAIIEAKRLGGSMEKALKQAKEYADCIGAKIVFAVDGGIVEVRWAQDLSYLRLDGQLMTDLMTEKELARFFHNGSTLSSPQKIARTKEDLIRIFAKTNDLLRQEGMREGIERFTEFANLLFLKLIDEIERDREARGEERRIEAKYCWEKFYLKPAPDMLDYINDTVLPELVNQYNHDGDVFASRLAIKNPDILKKIVDELSALTLLDVDSDIKGDAFEYFLKNSVTVGNDLGEYYTPRHIVKLVVDLVHPKFGDKVYDPCCGTGGFLIEAYRHILRNCSPTKENLTQLENHTIFGGELTGTAKIAKMNMILAGDGHTNIIQQDSLADHKREQYDVVVTNFPFSQKTEWAHLYGLSSTQANSVFLKHVIDALVPGGTAGVVVPDSVLFSKDRDSIKVRRQLKDSCEVQAIIQLDVYTFAPYTLQPTSIIIFRKSGLTKDGKTKVGPTKRIWFFEVTNDGFSRTTKRRPIEQNDLPLLRSLWNDKVESDHSFVLNADDIGPVDCKLFLNYYKKRARVKNPMELGQICEHFLIGFTPSTKNAALYGDQYPWVTIGDMRDKEVNDTAQGLSELGAELATPRRKISKGSLLMSFKLTLGKTAFAGQDLFTNEAICALALKEEYDTEETKEYLYHVLPLIDYVPYAQRAAKGPTLNKALIATVEVPFPDEKERSRLVREILALEAGKEQLEQKLEENSRKRDAFIASDIMSYTAPEERPRRFGELHSAIGEGSQGGLPAIRHGGDGVTLSVHVDAVGITKNQGVRVAKLIIAGLLQDAVLKIASGTSDTPLRESVYQKVPRRVWLRLLDDLEVLDIRQGSLWIDIYVALTAIAPLLVVLRPYLSPLLPNLEANGIYDFGRSVIGHFLKPRVKPPEIKSFNALPADTAKMIEKVVKAVTKSRNPMNVEVLDPSGNRILNVSSGPAQ